MTLRTIDAMAHMELVRIRGGRVIDSAEVDNAADGDLLKRWANRKGEDPYAMELRVRAKGQREQRIRV